MLIKGQDIRNIKGGEKIANTLKKDCFENQKMRFVIMNPPFGTPWGGKDAPEGQEKAVKEEYKKDFNIEIELELETDREDQQPKPLTIYTVNKRGDYHQGIIFIAKIKNDKDFNYDQSKFSDAKFVKESEIDSISGEKVKDFKNSLQKGFEYIKKKGENE